MISCSSALNIFQHYDVWQVFSCHLFPFTFLFVFSAPTGASLPKQMLIAYLLSLSLFNLLTDHFLFRALQHLSLIYSLNRFRFQGNHILKYLVFRNLTFTHKKLLSHSRVELFLLEGRQQKAKGRKGPLGWIFIRAKPSRNKEAIALQTHLSRSLIWPP